MPLAAALAGRRIDEANAKKRRFPLVCVPAVRRALSELLQAEQIELLVSSAACGADLLALDVALTLGIRCRVLLPFGQQRFRETSVIDRPGNWGEIYDRVISAVDARDDLLVLRAGGDDDKSYQKTNEAIIQEAVTPFGPERAVAVIVWEGHARGKDDATAQFRRLAVAAGMAERIVSTLCE